MKWPDRPSETVRLGNGYNWLDDFTKWNTRTPGGHPEGFIEAFANIYRNFGKTLRALDCGETPTAEQLDFPTVEDGARDAVCRDDGQGRQRLRKQMDPLDRKIVILRYTQKTPSSLREC